ncbi:hypothetical protein HZH68_012589 [Vespula germanica]|uniref:Uncharacterized protein n=1 Tax=Vespula germanica TaxID=30212 RepID=A0A834JK70_VESGE|nr:hypothetical protein HZH68_012589 [Vespula germanica]
MEREGLGLRLEVEVRIGVGGWELGLVEEGSNAIRRPAWHGTERRTAGHSTVRHRTVWYWASGSWKRVEEGVKGDEMEWDGTCAGFSSLTKNTTD